MPRLADRVAVVTGAARGMGHAIATLFAEEGAAVVACDILEPTKDFGNERGPSECGVRSCTPASSRERKT
ncbi:MAG TPA: SDR family NAD(P)-dependent oxidoreductase [Gaiellaceae bacterium]|nr:SDR family NAD(P)-dependent oxidoreductase [Gaiellaceae bacterium]